MKKKNNFKGFFGIIALAVVLAFALAGCGEKPGGSGPSGPVKYTVTFDANGGTVSPSSVEVESGKTVTSLPTPTKTSGDTNFWGWFTKNGTGGDWGSSFAATTPVTENINVYARWGSTAEPTRHTITFNVSGGTVSPSSKQVISGLAAGDLPVPTKSNNTFGGWYTVINGGGTVFTSASIVTASISVYAKWTIIEAPIARAETRQLTDANWRAILTEINAAGKYVNLDLSACTRSDASTGGGLRSDGTFDPISSLSTGKNYITSLILPNVTTSIVAGSFTNPTFQRFSSLENLSASAVTNIGESAFSSCTSLVSLNLPQSTNIGESAFSSCTSLVSVNLPQATSIDGHMTFSGCTSLTSVSFPRSTSIISVYRTFSGCTSLVSFTLTGTGSLSTIEDGKVLVRNNTELVAYPSASGNITLNSITSIDAQAFLGCTSLTSVSFPQAVQIFNYAFEDCTSLASVSFPQATSIGSAFINCTSLANVNFPLVINIGGSAFTNCTSLVNASFPQATDIGTGKVDHIEGGAFSGCTNLTSVSFPQATAIYPFAFSKTGVMSIILGQSAPTLGRSIFDSINSAKTVTVKVPASATGYGTISVTYSGTDTTVNWGNGFRGGGWDGTRFVQDGGANYINRNITLKVEYQ